jgi:hypothetical protein
MSSPIGARSHSGRDRLAVTAFACLLAVAAVHAGFVTYFTGVLAEREFLSDSFDSLARRLPAWDASVDEEAIGWEGIKDHGKTFLYFGPWPALVRIVPLGLVPGMYGRWARISTLAAACIAMAAFAWLAARSLRANPRLTSRARRVWLAASVIGFGLGTPLLFLVSCARVYHEAMAWGLALSLASLAALLEIVRDAPRRRLAFLLFSTFLGATLLARLTFALPLCLMAAVLFVAEATRALRRRTGALGLGTLAAAALPAAAGAAYAMWYNLDRFGSPFKLFSYAGWYADPATFGGDFNLLRIPSALFNYFAVPAATFLAHPPFVNLAHTVYFDPAIFFDWHEETLSFTVGSPWLLLGAALGAWMLVRERGTWLAKAALAALAVQAVLISSYFFITQRYAAELMPLLAFAYAWWLSRADRGTPLGRGVAWAFAPLLLVSVLATPVSTVYWNLKTNGDVPLAGRARLAELFRPRGEISEWKGRRVYVSDAAPAEQKAGNMELRNDQTIAGRPIVMDGRFFPRGLGMHAPCAATWEVPVGAVAFEAAVGLPDEARQCGEPAVDFAVTSDDGRTLFASGRIDRHDPARAFRVELGGARRVTLVLGDGGNGIDCDHGVWGGAAFLLP